MQIKSIAAWLFAAFTLTATAEIQIINGVKYECRDGLCMLVEDDADSAAKDDSSADATSILGDAAIPGLPTDEPLTDIPVAMPIAPVAPDAPVETAPVNEAPALPEPTRIAQGYMNADELVAFLKGDAAETSPFAGKAMWLIVLLAVVGGLAMNLTPCVLPMIPINLMVIGKSAARGGWYGLGIALAYGIMGVLAAVGGMAFGEIQSNPWFNIVVAVVFVVLGLALCEVFFIDFSGRRAKVAAGVGAAGRQKSGFLFPLFMGALSAVLAGACVAPILISVLLLTAKLFAEGNWFALGLPFALGAGMALPWPFLGAGMQVLPKPGGWMKRVNRIFAVIVFGFAAWYAFLAYRGFAGGQSATGEAPATDESVIAAVPSSLGERLATAKRPVFVDCWATWCKNCAAMEHGTFKESAVVDALRDFTVIKLQAEDIRELKALPGMKDIRGLPAFVIYE